MRVSFALTVPLGRVMWRTPVLGIAVLAAAPSVYAAARGHHDLSFPVTLATITGAASVSFALDDPAEASTHLLPNLTLHPPLGPGRAHLAHSRRRVDARRRQRPPRRLHSRTVGRTAGPGRRCSRDLPRLCRPRQPRRLQHARPGCSRRNSAHRGRRQRARPTHRVAPPNRPPRPHPTLVDRRRHRLHTRVLVVTWTPPAEVPTQPERTSAAGPANDGGHQAGRRTRP